MADVATLTASIRERVKDDVVDGDATPPRPLYADATYTRAINRGLARVNLDLNKDWTLALVPVRYEYLVELRGTIEMVRIRASEGGSSLIVEEFGEVQSVSVPNLTVTNTVSPKRGTRTWNDLLALLEEEYADLLAAVESTLGTAATEVSVGTLVRRSMRTGRHGPYAEIAPLTAPQDFAVSVDGLEVTLSWSPIYSTRVSAYLIDVADNANMEGATQKFVVLDNRQSSRVDTPGVGTWYYRLGVEDDQGERRYTAVGTVVVE